MPTLTPNETLAPGETPANSSQREVQLLICCNYCASNKGTIEIDKTTITNMFHGLTCSKYHADCKPMHQNATNIMKEGDVSLSNV